MARWQSGKIANAAPEYEDCRKLPTANSIPMKQIMADAMRDVCREEKGGAQMDRSHIEALLNDVQANRTTVRDALERLKDLPFEDLGFAKLDHHRRCAPVCRKSSLRPAKRPTRWRRSSRTWQMPAAMFWPRAPRGIVLKR